MGAYLSQLNNGRRFELERRESVLGRHPDCDVQIEVGAVSRHHAKILNDSSQFLLEDLRSRNFTYLNEQRIEGQHPLKHGDRITVCDVVFLFQNPDESGLDGQDGSTFAIVIDEEEGQMSSTIMSKLDVSSSSRGRVQIAASPEAKLNALIEITQTLGAALSLDEVLPKVLESLFKIFMQADRGFIGLNDEEGVLVPRWFHARREDVQDRMRISRTIVNGVMDSKEAILSADAATDERFDMSQSVADFRIRSMMCVPLTDSDNDVIGVLQVDTLDQRKRFQEEDLEVLVSVGLQAGIAITNAQMHERALKQRAVERDLQLAHEVQQSFLPNARPQLEEYQFYDYYQPANHVGGDLYDYIFLPDGRIAILVADVVGHGVAAALLMAKLGAEARYCLASETQPAQAVTALNERMSSIGIDRFVTLVLAVLDPHSHEVVIVNAGHMAPILRHASGGIEEPGEEAKGLPIMVIDEFDYEQMSLRLKPGESLTMYTDGINEASSENEASTGEEQFGIPRIRKLVSDSDGLPEHIGKEIVTDVHSFIGSGDQEDDMCLVTIGRRG